MSKQHAIDSLSFSAQGSQLAGRIDLADLPRLRDQLVHLDGSVEFELTGKTGDQGEALLLLSLRGVLPMGCQRCLGVVEIPLDAELLYELRSDVDENVLTQEELEDDSRDYLLASRSLDVVALIEDEALLALPIVARHDGCDLPDHGHDPKAASPFGELLKLKGHSGKTH